MKPFDYTVPRSVDDAVRAASAPNTRFIAGGTNLIDLMKIEVETPAHLVDLNPLAESDSTLRSVGDAPGGGLRIGALTPMSDVAWDPRVKDRYPVLSQALLLGASGQLRNMASMGGNLLQRTRCPYFRDTALPCNKREPGSGCSAIGGFNRSHAILGTSQHCIATHPSDLAIALVALDATIRVKTPGSAGSAGDRTIAVADLHVLPGAHPERETVLRPGEMITAIEVPALPFARRSLYLKVRDRASYAFALASAAVAVNVVNGTIRDARVALGGIGTKPWRSRSAERALIGKPAVAASFRAAANAALQGAVTHKDNAFKVELAKRTLVRALTEVVA
jgi:xanthine dehydrogenase YagS FAD-binding subunit